MSGNLRAAEPTEDDVAEANRLLAPLAGEQLIQFRMGYGVWLEIGYDYEINILTPVEIRSENAQWQGEPLSAEAAGALLPFTLQEVKSVIVGADRSLTVSFQHGSLRVPPNWAYEAWQARGVEDGMLIVCVPGGESLACWVP